MHLWSGGHTSKGGSVGQTNPPEIISRHMAASAGVALVIIVVITPTAPSVARAITMMAKVLFVRFCME